MSSSDQFRRDVSDGSLFLLFLFFLGLVLTAIVVPGVFTVDENNYLVNVIAFRHGHVTLANTGGLTSSRELLFFDPSPWTRAIVSTPVASTAPPLYAALALPFSYFGWRGLVALNTLAYLATAAMIFWWLRRFSKEKSTPWLGAAAFALGGFSLEYSIGLWPHALSVALCTAGVLSAAWSIETRSAKAAAVAGFCLALAMGVRYQNAVIVAAVGGALLLWSIRRVPISFAFGAAAMFPLLASSAINYMRLGSWNPISKGPGYLQVPFITKSGESWWDPLVMFWARVVDYSKRPPLIGPAFEGWFVHDPTTGANLILGVTLKKALLQSAPWAAVSLLLFALVWFPKFRISEPRRQLRLFSFVTLCVLVVFALSTNRDDGLSFNQRYLLEIVPLCAIAFGFACDDWLLPSRPVIGGAISGALLVLAILAGTPMMAGAENPGWVVRQFALLHVPLLLAAILCALWVCSRTLLRYRPAVAAFTGVCLGWSLFLHLGDDVLMSVGIRKNHLETTNALASLVPPGAAVLTSWAAKEPLGPLLLSRDIVIIAVGAHEDEGVDTPLLVRQLLQQRRKVLLLDENIPARVRQRSLEGLEAIPVPHSEPPLLELRLKQADSSGSSAKNVAPREG